MTSESTAQSAFLNSRDLIASLRAGAAMFLKVIMGGLVVLAAGILTVAVAMVGLILAAVAVCYRMVAGAPKPVTPRATGDGIILEAHETPHGWTVE